MSDCLFCKIIAGEIPGNAVFENDKIYAFRDINPQAPVHVLVVPKKHMDNILQCDAETAAALTDAVRRSPPARAWPRAASGSSATAAGTAPSRSTTCTST